MQTNPEIMSVQISPVENLDGFTVDARAWVEKKSGAGAHAWLLAYADDGFIWGELTTDKLVLAKDIFAGAGADLEPQTLQHLYIFNEAVEIHIWRGEESFRGARMADGPDSKTESFDNDLLLWGTKIYAGPTAGFTWMEDGVQGLRHAVPLEVDPQMLNEGRLARPLQLKIRQYLNYDGSGQAYVQAVRLVKLFTGVNHG